MLALQGLAVDPQLTGPRCGERPASYGNRPFLGSGLKWTTGISDVYTPTKCAHNSPPFAGSGHHGTQPQSTPPPPRTHGSTRAHPRPHPSDGTVTTGRRGAGGIGTPTHETLDVTGPPTYYAMGIAWVAGHRVSDRKLGPQGPCGGTITLGCWAVNPLWVTPSPRIWRTCDPLFVMTPFRLRTGDHYYSLCTDLLKIYCVV